MRAGSGDALERPGRVAGTPAPAGGRLRASGWDYLLIVGWLGVLTVVGVLARLTLPPPDGAVSLLAADLLAFAATVLPVWAYLTAAEGSVAQASWGKRRAGLRVVDVGGGTLGRRRAGARNAVKLLPWQLGHLAAARLALDADAVVTTSAAYALSLVVPAVSVTMAWRDPLRRALHDRVAGTRVVSA